MLAKSCTGLFGVRDLKMRMPHTLLVLVIGCILPSLGQDPGLPSKQTGEEQARKLWELAIEAKGGRQRLEQVQSFLETYGKKHKVVTLYVFPDRYWRWADERPSPFGISVEMHNLEKGLGYFIMKKDPAPQLWDDTQYAEERLLRAQHMYFMETRWVRPVPTEAKEGVRDGKPVDVIYARWDRWTVKYVLDKTTHLPLAFDFYSQPEDEGALPRRFADYVAVDGIQLPSSVHYGGETPFIKQSYLINPRYNERLFEQPPSIKDGPDAWRPLPR